MYIYTCMYVCMYICICVLACVYVHVYIITNVFSNFKIHNWSYFVFTIGFLIPGNLL